MLTVSASSDRTGERRLHASGAALAAAAGLACCAFAGNEWQALAALSLSAAGVMSLMTVHWSIPPLFLSDWARASGIAVINSIGNTAGFFGPRIIGQEALLSGGLPAGFLICAGVMAAAAVLLIIFAPRRVKN
jgi:MFS family permease